MPVLQENLKELTELHRFLLPFRPHDKDDCVGSAVLARYPVRTLGALDAHDKTLQSYLPLPSPLKNLHAFTHSNETTTSKNTNSLHHYTSTVPHNLLPINTNKLKN